MDARTYEITVSDVVVDRFRTGPTADASADENAISDLVDYTRVHHGGPYTLSYLSSDGETAVAICEADAGRTRLLVDEDAVAADSVHTGPELRADPVVTTTWRAA